MAKRWLPILSCVLLVAGGLLWLRAAGKQGSLSLLAQEKNQALEEKRQQLKELSQKLELATDLDGLLEIQKELSDLSGEEAEKLKSYTDLSLAIAHYEAAEDLLYQAQSLAEPMRGVVGIETNPSIAEKFSKAMEHYKQAKKQIDQLKDRESDTDYNFHLHYARGNIYYRVLTLLATDEEKREFFDQTAIAWERALDFYSKDHDTQVNLELLRLNQSQLLSGAASDDMGKLMQMPQLLPRNQSNQGVRKPKGKY